MRISQPKENEPIRLVHTKSGHKYRAVITTGQHADGKRRQETRTFTSLSAAREWIAETRTSVRQGTYTARDRTSVGALCDAWLASKRDVRPVTRNAYANVLKAVRARLGAMHVQDVHRSDVEGFVTWLDAEGGKKGEGVSHRTVVFTLGTVRQVFAYAVAEGTVATNPAQTVKAPRRESSDRREVTVWMPEQLRTFVAQADGHEWAAAWRLTASGLRRSEVCGLRWADVDFRAGTVHVSQGRVSYGGTVVTDDAKSGASVRTVPVESMHAGSMSLLRSLSVRQAKDRLAAGSAWEESGLVLVDALGAGVSPDVYSNRFKALCRSADLPSIRLHDVRHSVATLLHSAGVAPAHCAALLGHGLQVHMSTYVARTQDGVNDAGEALGRLLAGTP